jgi:hypothetical protein
LFKDSNSNYLVPKDEKDDENIHIAIRAAWQTLYETWNDNDELDLETKDANLSGLLFHQNLPNRISFDGYYKLLAVMRWSDRADFWAFFHQCWNLLPLSYNLKLKYPNKYLSYHPYPSDKIVPKVTELQYTFVLTKQSALFNSWKEMNRVSNEFAIPFRCVSQWATYQTGKIKDILGLAITTPETSNEELLKVLSSSSAPLTKTKSSSGRKKAVRKKKSNETPS